MLDCRRLSWVVQALKIMSLIDGAVFELAGMRAEVRLLRQRQLDIDERGGRLQRWASAIGQPSGRHQLGGIGPPVDYAHIPAPADPLLQEMRELRGLIARKAAIRQQIPYPVANYRRLAMPEDNFDGISDGRVAPVNNYFFTSPPQPRGRPRTVTYIPSPDDYDPAHAFDYWMRGGAHR